MNNSIQLYKIIWYIFHTLCNNIYRFQEMMAIQHGRIYRHSSKVEKLSTGSVHWDLKQNITNSQLTQSSDTPGTSYQHQHVAHE